MRSSKLFQAVLLSVTSMFLLTACPPEVPPEGVDGGADAGPVFCQDATECPAEAPICDAGVCVASSDPTCTSDADCPGSTCNQLTGYCDPCEDCCADEADCEGGQICQGFHCVAGGNPCSTVDECEAGQICEGDKCVAYDSTAACTTDADCPRDHVCNALGDGSCQGCINDNDCDASAHGPKCDTTDDANGPGPGYCYVECGTGLPDCVSPLICDDDRGGICVAGCATRADCEEGLICFGAFKCAPCETNSQCESNEICSQGRCIENPGCMDGDTDLCVQNLGAAYFCDGITQQCQLGCTDSGCDTTDTANCNPCTDGAACDPTTHECGGAGCEGGCLDPMTGAPTDCGAMGMVCDSVTCQCTVPGGSGSGSGEHCSPCMGDADCLEGYVCDGFELLVGMPGRCFETCSMANNSCGCSAAGAECKNLFSTTIGLVGCMLGQRGVCQGECP